MTVFTIGYEGLDIAEFVAVLRQHAIRTVVDIRELPLSRKRGFSKQSLATRLGDEGLGYVHLRELGCPRSVRDQYKGDGDWARYTKGFLHHLDKQAYAISQLSERVATTACALLCFEADYRYCHRSFVADAVQRHAGVAVQHLVA